MMRNRTRMPGSGLRSIAAGLAGGLAYGVLTWTAFAASFLWFGAFLAPAGLILVGERAARGGYRVWALAVGAALGSLPMWLVEHIWVASMTKAGLVPLTMYLSLYPGLFVWAYGRLRRSFGRIPCVVVAGAVWGALEYLRGTIAFDGYPWLLAGHPLIEVPVLAGGARVIGAYGISMLCVGVSACLCLLVRGHIRSAMVSGGVLGAIWAGMSLVPGGGEQGVLRVAMCQTNLPQSVRGAWGYDDRVEAMRTLIALSMEARDRIGDATPAAIVWPETMYPGFFLDDDSVDAVRGFEGDGFDGFRRFVLDHAQAVRELSRSIGVPLIVGFSRFEDLVLRVEDARIVWDGSLRFNSAAVIRDGVIADTYDKLLLTPFGEVMPYISNWERFERLLADLGGNGMPFDLSSGTRDAVLRIDDAIACATPICFEATVPRVVRRLVFDGGVRQAQIIVNLTNDGWFAGSEAGRRLHLLGARWRCVELATAMARAANTGITCVVDRHGRVVEALPTHIEGVLVHDVPLASGTTVYARTGDLLPALALAGTILSLGVSYVGSRRRARADGKSEDPGTKDGGSV